MPLGVNEQTIKWFETTQYSTYRMFVVAWDPEEFDVVTSVQSVIFSLPRFTHDRCILNIKLIHNEQ